MSNRFIRMIINSLPMVLILCACQSTPGVVPTADISSPLDRGFKLFADEPLLSLGPSGRWDSLMLDPGAVVFHDGKFHMFFNSTSAWPATLAVGYAVSPDGMTWTRVGTQPVFNSESIHWQSMPGNIQANSVLVEDGIWILYFTASDAADRLTGAVGRATASSPAGPWTVDSEPVLRPGEFSEWDGGAIGHVDVIRSDKGYVMYYSSTPGIGMASSPDGIKWTKYNNPATTKTDVAKSDPVLNKLSADDPNVQQTAWGWAMVFHFENSLHYAASLDGIHWAETPDNPIVDLAGKDIWYSDFVVHDGMAFLYFEAGAGKASPYLAIWLEEA